MVALATAPVAPTIIVPLPLTCNDRAVEPVPPWIRVVVAAVVLPIPIVVVLVVPRLTVPAPLSLSVSTPVPLACNVRPVLVVLAPITGLDPLKVRLLAAVTAPAPVTLKLVDCNMLSQPVPMFRAFSVAAPPVRLLMLIPLTVPAALELVPVMLMPLTVPPVVTAPTLAIS